MHRSTTPTSQMQYRASTNAGSRVHSPDRRRDPSSVSSGAPARAFTRTVFRSNSTGPERGTPSRKPTAEPRTPSGARGFGSVQRSTTPTNRSGTPTFDRSARPRTPTAPSAYEPYHGEDLTNPSGDTSARGDEGAPYHNYERSDTPSSAAGDFGVTVVHRLAVDPQPDPLAMRYRAPTVTSMDTPPGTPKQPQAQSDSPGPADYAAETSGRRPSTPSVQSYPVTESARERPATPTIPPRPPSPTIVLQGSAAAAVALAPVSSAREGHETPHLPTFSEKTAQGQSQQGEFQGVRKAVVNLKEANVALERELAATKREIADLRKALDRKLKGPTGPQPRLDKELKQALQETAEAKEATAEAQRQHHQTDSKVKELQQTLKQLTNFNAALEREKAQLKQEAEASHEDRRAIKRELKELREQLKTVQGTRFELEQQRDQQGSTILQLQQDRKEAQARLSNAEARYKELREGAGTAKERREALERERLELEEKLRRAADDLRQSKDRSKQADQRARDSKDAATQLRRELSDLETERQRLLQLEEVMAREPSGPEQVDLLEARARKLEATVRQLSQTNDGDTARFHSEVVERRARLGLGVPPAQLLQELEDQLSQLRQSHRLLVRSREDLEAFVQSKVSRLEHSGSQAEANRKTAELQQAETALRAEVEQLTSERTSLLAEAERYRLEAVQLRASNHRHHVQIQQIQEKIDRLRTQANHLPGNVSPTGSKTRSPASSRPSSPTSSVHNSTGGIRDYTSYNFVRHYTPSSYPLYYHTARDFKEPVGNGASPPGSPHRSPHPSTPGFPQSIRSSSPPISPSATFRRARDRSPGSTSVDGTATFIPTKPASPPRSPPPPPDVDVDASPVYVQYSPPRFDGLSASSTPAGSRSPSPAPPPPPPDSEPASPSESKHSYTGKNSASSGTGTKEVDPSTVRARLNEQRAEVYRELESEVFKAEQRMAALEQAGHENLRLLSADLGATATSAAAASTTALSASRSYASTTASGSAGDQLALSRSFASHTALGLTSTANLGSSHDSLRVEAFGRAVENVSPSASYDSQRFSGGNSTYSPAQTTSSRAGSPFSPDGHTPHPHHQALQGHEIDRSVRFDDVSRSPSPAPSPASSYVSPVRSTPSPRKDGGWLPESLRCLLVELQLQEDVQRKVVVDHERIALRALMIIGHNKLQRIPQQGTVTRASSPALSSRATPSFATATAGLGTSLFAGSHSPSAASVSSGRTFLPSPAESRADTATPTPGVDSVGRWTGLGRSPGASSTASFDPQYERRLRPGTPDTSHGHGAAFLRLQRSATPPAVVFEPVDRRYAHFEPDSPPLNSTEWLVRAMQNSNTASRASSVRSTSPGPADVQ